MSSLVVMLCLLVAQLRVVRTGGLFGEVTIPYEVIAMHPDSEGAMLSDISPTRGALVFSPQQQSRVTPLPSYRHLY